MICSAIPSFAQGLPHYEIQMDSVGYDLLYTRDIFSDSLLKLTSVRHPTALSPERTDGWIRFKGHSTRYYPKKAYRLKFDADVTTPIGPVRSLNLNAMYTDKSFIRENFCWLAYEDIGALAPGATYATATINGHYKGLFLQIDKIDKYFLTNRGRKRAPMYEADDLYTSADLTVQPDSLLKLYYAKEIGDANDYSDLAAMIATLNGADSASFPTVVDDLFDIRSVLSWFAVNTLVTEEDSYNKNYFLNSCPPPLPGCSRRTS
jgi:spore coat protein H